MSVVFVWNRRTVILILNTSTNRIARVNRKAVRQLQRHLLRQTLLRIVSHGDTSGTSRAMDAMTTSSRAPQIVLLTTSRTVVEDVKGPPIIVPTRLDRKS